MNELIDIITSSADDTRNRSLASVCAAAPLERLLEQAEHLDEFRRSSQNLYHCVRAQLFLSAIYRYYVPRSLPLDNL